MELYQRIRKCREELGLSQEELAQKMGYKSRSSINKIEMGENDIPQSKIVQFARALNTTPAYLMGWEDNPDQKEKAPALTKKDERDIADFMEALEGGDTLMYYGEPLSEEAKESIRAAMQLGIGAAKLEAKRKFTPKKYRKE